MKRLAILLSAGIISTSVQAAPQTTFTLGAGLRSDDFNWNIAGNISGTSPNILSELTWESVESYVVDAGLKIPLSDFNTDSGFSLVVDGYYGWNYDGDNQDSDYTNDNRQGEFSRSNNSSEDGDLYGGSVGLMWSFHSPDGLSVDLSFGGSHRAINLQMTDGYQTINTINPANVGPFAGLDSSYDAELNGYWFGLGTQFKLSPKFRMALNGKYHHDDYEAQAQWNLRTDLRQPVSFEHWADGSGYDLEVELFYALSEDSELSLQYSYTEWSADNGTDLVYFANGSTGATLLNEVNWESESLFLHWNAHF